MLNKLKLIWAFLDGNKTLIGLALAFCTDYFIPDKTWYHDLIELVAMVFIGGGGIHKLIKVKYGS